MNTATGSFRRIPLVVGVGVLSAAALASGQTPNGRPMPSSPREQATFLIETQLNDTSAIQRSVALHLLQRSSAPVREEALALIRVALTDTSARIRGRALGALERLGVDAKPLMGTLLSMARNAREPNREYIFDLLTVVGGSSSEVRAALNEALLDANEDIRLAAAVALRNMGEWAHSRAMFSRSLSSADVETRLWAARQLADLNDSAAVPVLLSFLGDTSFRRRTQAAIGLGALGPVARGAVGELSKMLQDTVTRRIPQGRAWVTEIGAPYAAWAIAQIFPFRSTFSNSVIDPLHVEVIDSARALRSDGLGVYAWGVDSVAVFRGSGFFFMLSSLGDGRGPIGPIDSTFRRSLTFDLSNPVAASGAQSLGAITDNEAYIWIWYKRDPVTDQVSTFRELPVSEREHSIERVEMHFRLNGVLHELQMGPFVEGQGGASQWYTGVHGNGTTLARFSRPSAQVWIVRAAAGSIARLWSFENRARPIDRGLYQFPFELRFRGIPGGATGGCVPIPTTCNRYPK